VIQVAGDGIRIDLSAPVKPGDGVVFDGDDAGGIPEQGGRVYEVRRVRQGRPDNDPTGPDGWESGPVELRFGRGNVDPKQVRAGQRVWKTDDPELSRRLRKTFEGPPQRKVELDLHVRAVVGEPLAIEATTTTGLRAVVTSEDRLVRADRVETTEELFRDQLGRLGGTIYRLRELTATQEGAPLVPRSLLNGLRRDLVARLSELESNPAPRRLAPEAVLPGLLATWDVDEDPHAPPELSVLCRDVAQIDAAVAAGIRTIYADFQDIKAYRDAIAASRRRSASIYLATPRIEKPFEANLFRYLAKQEPDGLLVRNAGGLEFCAERKLPFVADFSLNAANELTVELLKRRGALRVTASYDLSFEQLDDLLAAVPKSWLEVVIHQRIPMFHMEHCVFCAFLSPGTDKTNCGRPCDVHDVKLRDRVGMEHPLKADVGCRNTLFNAVPQTAAEYLPRLLARGATNLRIEFLDDTPELVERTLSLYRDALDGRRDSKTLWHDLKATSRYGVTRGSLSIL
jgi:putative protease